MIKELFLALALGALLGFGLTGTYLAVKNNNQAPTKEIAQTSAEKLSPTLAENLTVTPVIGNDIGSNINNQSHKITIDSPLNESISSSAQITLKGSTTANSSIIITTTKQTIYTTASDIGNFNYDLTLESGVNIIQIDSISPSDDIATSQILVTYSTAKF